MSDQKPIINIPQPQIPQPKPVQPVQPVQPVPPMQQAPAVIQAPVPPINTSFNGGAVIISSPAGRRPSMGLVLVLVCFLILAATGFFGYNYYVNNMQVVVPTPITQIRLSPTQIPPTAIPTVEPTPEAGILKDDNTVVIQSELDQTVVDELASDAAEIDKDLAIL